MRISPLGHCRISMERQKLEQHRTDRPLSVVLLFPISFPQGNVIQETSLSHVWDVWRLFSRTEELWMRSIANDIELRGVVVESLWQTA